MCEGGAGPDTPLLNLETVGRLQVSDEVAGARVDDDCMVAADLGVGEDNVVVSAAADSGGRRPQLIALSRGVAQSGDSRPGVAGCVSAGGDDCLGGGRLRSPLHVQRLLAQDALVQSL